MKQQGLTTLLGCIALSLAVLTISSPAYAQRWHVERAEYGAGGRFADVTNVVRELVHSGEGRVQVSNYSMRIDPAYGEVKVLRIFAEAGDGERREFTFRENELIDLEMFRHGGDRGGREEGYRPPPPVWGRGRRPAIGACFYRDPNFRGDYFCMKRGMSYESLPPGFNDRITSIRVAGGAEVAIFNDTNFRGVTAASREGIRDLRYWRLPTDPSRSWNDRVSSVQVR
jgi:hypothetical protein